MKAFAVRLGVVAALTVLPPPAVASGVVGIGTADSCTEAVLDTAVAGGGKVTFDCGSAPVTITLTQEKTISSETTVDGGGLITLDGNHAVRVFVVEEASALSVENLTIANGQGIGAAGAIYNVGLLTVTNSTFSGNSATIGGVPGPGEIGTGGAIYNSGTLTVTNSTFSGNSAPGGSGLAGGGAIANADRSGGPGTLTVTNSTFSGNSGGLGGAIANGDGNGSVGGTLTVTNSTFSSNSGLAGGAIYNFRAGGLTVTNSTFSRNSTTAGGAIANLGLLTVTNSTFSGNSGGGISNGSCPRWPPGYPPPCPATLRNTIVADSTQGGNCEGLITDGGHNLDDGTTCGFTGTSFSNTDPKLDPVGLASNGGPTQTIALQARSPAINAGNEIICADRGTVNNLDQRGFVRPGAGATNCSIGAYEFNSGPACGLGLCVFPQVCTSGQCSTPTPTNTATPPSSTPTPTNTATLPPTNAVSTDGGGGGGCTIAAPARSGEALLWLMISAVLVRLRRRRSCRLPPEKRHGA